MPVSENRKFLLPPSALNPYLVAIASRSVDFPEPFSPMKNVTAGWNSNRFRCRTAGMQNGHPSKLATDSRSNRTACRKVFLMMGGIVEPGDIVAITHQMSSSDSHFWSFKRE